MSKDHGRLPKRLIGERSAAVAISRPKRGRSQPGSTADSKTATGRRLVSPDTDRRRGLTQDLNLLAAGLGRIAAQAFRQVRIGRFSAPLADIHQLVCKYPLRAVLVGVGLGYFLSRTKVS
jgi:hypothetical protein